MWSISDLKKKGKAAFKNNYWRCVLVSLILAILTAGSSATGSGNSARNADQMNIDNEQIAAALAIVAGFIVIFTIIWCLLRIFVLNPLEVGCHSFLKKNIEGHPDLSCLKDGFADYKKSALTLLLRDIYLALWFCLFLIPGIVKAYSYMMVPYIVMDNPELSPKEVITKSRQMMNGHKWRAFCLDFSFIGWGLLSSLTLGLVGLFYGRPYRRSTRAALYLEIKDLV
ncbi:MAG: DUF975 family protein [Lachnospiraceae bacterium]|nr:DUF975 family protein [Lachnospiraceae bacterium]